MKKVCVIGSYNADLTAKAPHIPMPGETILGSGFSVNNGGKGSNQAVAAKKAGAEISFGVKLGRDSFGEKALALYDSIALDTSYVLFSDKPTGAALIMVNENTAENCILVSSGSNLDFDKADEAKLKRLIDECEYALFQLEISPKVNFSLMKYAGMNGKKVILNTAPVSEIPPEIYQYLWCITPNEHEASMLTEMSIGSDIVAFAEKCSEELLNRGIKNVIITLGSQGSFIRTASETRLIPAFKVNAVDTTGAGDAYNGAFLAGLQSGMDIFAACGFATAAAAISVSRQGAAESSPFKEEIEEFLSKRK